MWYHVFVIAFMAAKTFTVYWKEQDCQSAGEKKVQKCYSYVLSSRQKKVNYVKKNNATPSVKFQNI